MPTYTSIHLAERPQDAVVAGKTFTPKQQEIPSASSLKDGEVLFQTLYLSLDPAMRGWLNPTRSYIPPVEIGAVMRGSGIGLIVASKSKKFPVGTYATVCAGGLNTPYLTRNMSNHWICQKVLCQLTRWACWV